jgi:hypothetical protein
MCNSLFPVRAAAFAIQLAQIPDVVKAYNDDRSRIALGDVNDGRTRMVLSSPRLCSAVCKHFKLKYFRARLAFSGERSFGINIPYLEVYTEEGKLISSTLVSDLEDELSDVVCMEIQDVLLKSKGIDVNTY